MTAPNQTKHLSLFCKFFLLDHLLSFLGVVSIISFNTCLLTILMYECSHVAQQYGMLYDLESCSCSIWQELIPPPSSPGDGYDLNYIFYGLVTRTFTCHYQHIQDGTVDFKRICPDF
ncbi:uncharacterized protein VTP21DRAFT_1234 [Calcarisporiella thermophila]|uniref:uncharacterized protein n=1 Tax=Calcarisporiella thermophila TaxID=911321 RepID=UPI0037428633